MSSTSTHKKVIAMKSLPVLLALALTFTLCMLPVAAEAAVNDTAKAVIVSLHYKDGTVTPVSSRVIYGYPPDNIANSDMIAELVGKNSNVIGSYGIEDPRVLYSDGGAVLENDMQFSVILPFNSSGQRVDLYDGATRAKLASADISGAVAGFCSSHRDDPDCGTAVPSSLLYGAVLVIALVIAGAGIFLFLMRRKRGGTV
jgi:hypothetical protein